MRRHKGLHPLSHDHHHALVQARALRRAGTSDATHSLEETVKAFLVFWELDGSRHFRKEEEVLLPAYDRHGDITHPSIAKMLQQHATIRRRVDDLAAAGDQPDASNLYQLGSLLDEHVRLEERIIFPMMEEQIPDEAIWETADKLKGWGGTDSDKSPDGA